MQTKKFREKILFLLRETINQYLNDDATKLAASLSYYTIFSLPPLLIIVIYLAGIFFGAEAVRGEIFGQINGLVGNNAAIQIQEMIKNIKLSNNDVGAYIIGVITLLLGAMGVFVELQDSINSIWGLKAKPKKGLILFLKNRLISFSMIGAMGFLLLVGLVINSLVDIIVKQMRYFFTDITVFLIHVINTAVLFILATLLFSIIFRTLPDGHVSYKDSTIGALFTALLFMVGKSAIGLFIGRSSIASIYGVAGSLIIIILWIYYSAIILYFGTEFTKVYALNYGDKIVPNDYTVYIKKDEKEIEP
jgi:membrane protein